MLLGALRRSIRHQFTPKQKQKQFKPADFLLLRMASTLPKLRLFEAIATHDPSSSVVIHSASGRRFAYGGLLSDVAQASKDLRRDAGDRPLDGERIAFLVENGYDYVGANPTPLLLERLRLKNSSDSSLHLEHQQHWRAALSQFSCSGTQIHTGQQWGLNAAFFREVSKQGRRGSERNGEQTADREYNPEAASWADLV
jgi:hypothetical protein